MVKTDLKFDKVSSVLISYHDLCADRERDRNYNPTVFSELSVSAKERANYLTYLTTKGISSEGLDGFKMSLFYPQFETLDDFLFAAGKQIPEKLKKDVRMFQKRSNFYFENLDADLNLLMGSRRESSDKLINPIYNIAEGLTGIAIERPKELGLRVVEGISPSSMGPCREGKSYVVMNMGNFLSSDNFLFTLIHEAVAHQTVNKDRKLMDGIFGGYVYSTEEGFAKLFTRKIAESIWGRNADYDTIGKEKIAYDVFRDNWESLKSGSFSEWYKGCLLEVKNKK